VTKRVRNFIGSINNVRGWMLLIEMGLLEFFTDYFKSKWVAPLPLWKS